MESFADKVGRVTVPAHDYVGMIRDVHDRFHVRQLLCLPAVNFDADFLIVVGGEFSELIERSSYLLDRFFTRYILVESVGLYFYPCTPDIVAKDNKFTSEIHVLLEYLGIGTVKFDV